MDNFQSNFYSPFTPPNYEVDSPFDASNDLVLEPDFYRDDVLYDTDKQQVSTEQLTLQLLNIGAVASIPEASCQLDLVGQLLTAPGAQYLPPNYGVSIQANKTALRDHHSREAHRIQPTRLTDSPPVSSMHHSDITFVYYNTPIVQSQEKPAYSIHNPTDVHLSSESTNDTSSIPINPPMNNANQRHSNKAQRHLAKNAGNNRYKCKLCDKTFSRPADRKRHEERTVRHGSGKKYPCDICKTTVLSRQSDVSRHRKKCLARRMQNAHLHKN